MSNVPFIRSLCIFYAIFSFYLQFLFTTLNVLDYHKTVVSFKSNVKVGILFFLAHIKSSSSDTVSWKRKQKNHARYFMALTVLTLVYKKKHIMLPASITIISFAIATLHWEDISCSSFWSIKFEQITSSLHYLIRHHLCWIH